MLERLKRLFRPKAVEVEYERRDERDAKVVPAGPPTGQMPQGAPLNDPAADDKPAS
jgi:hypothetical protein